MLPICHVYLAHAVNCGYVTIASYKRTRKKMEYEGDAVIPIVVGALGMVLKHLDEIVEELEIRGRVETM